MFKKQLCFTFLIAIFLLILGCSGGSSTPVLPPPAQERETTETPSHQTWGLWQFIADPEAGTLDVIQLREGTFHLNALPFLEPPALLNLTLESLEFNGNIIDADIGLRHPFLGLTEFTGYDVCGILISNGSITGFADANLRMAGGADTYLMNPDALSRWWNPVEFPVNSGNIFGYTDGLLGVPDSIADFNCTLNGYKYFCDDLVNPDDPMSLVTIPERGKFSAGQKNVRHYTIYLGDAGLEFNYAVDASWLFPTGDPPYSAPDDFPAEANRPEAWNIVVTEVENTLYNDGASSGGDLKLNIDVYDWFNADLNSVQVEAPGYVVETVSTNIVNSGDGFSTYEVEIIGATPPADEVELLISVACEEGDFAGFIPGINTTSYFLYTALVGTDPPLAYYWELDSGTFVQSTYQHDDNSPAIAWETDNQLRLYWTADSTSDWAGSPHAQSRSMRSDNGGTTWVDLQGHWGHGNDYCWDHAKINAATNGNSFATHPIGGPNDTPYYQAATAGDKSMGYQWAFQMIRYQDCAEIFCAQDGYIHFFGDMHNSYPSGIYQKKGNQQWTLLNDWSGYPPPIPWPQMWGPLTPTLVVNPPAHISNTRSIIDDSTGTVFLAYWGGAGNEFIEVARSTDGATAESWDSVTVFDEAGYSNVRDPGIDVDANDRIHISFIRHNDSSNEDEICYTYSTDGGGSWSAAQVVYSTSNVLTDTPIVAYQHLGASVVAICFEENDTVYFVSSFNAGSLWETPMMVSYLANDSDKMPDMIEGTDNLLHFVFSHDEASSRAIHARNATLMQG